MMTLWISRPALVRGASLELEWSLARDVDID